MIQRIYFFLVAVMSPSCTVVHVHGADPKTSVHLGILRIVPDESANSISYRVRGLGLIPGLNGLTLGYAQEDAVLVFDPDDCRIIVFEQPRLRPDETNWLEPLAHNPRLCEVERQ